jgi:hypothetical protein
MIAAESKYAQTLLSKVVRAFKLHHKWHYGHKRDKYVAQEHFLQLVRRKCLRQWHAKLIENLKEQVMQEEASDVMERAMKQRVFRQFRNVCLELKACKVQL